MLRTSWAHHTTGIPIVYWNLNIILYMWQEWNDYNLRWNDTEYGGVKDLRITPSKLWKPDVLMYNRWGSCKQVCGRFLKFYFQGTRYNKKYRWIIVWYIGIYSALHNSLIGHTLYRVNWKIVITSWHFVRNISLNNFYFTNFEN